MSQENQAARRSLTRLAAPLLRCALALSTLAGCGTTGSDGPVGPGGQRSGTETGYLVVNVPATLEVGKTHNAEAFLIDDQSGEPSPATVTWMSSDESIATVDANGVIQAHALGTTAITARTAGGHTVQDDLDVVNLVWRAVPMVSCDAGNTLEAEGWACSYDVQNKQYWVAIAPADGDLCAQGGQDRHMVVDLANHQELVYTFLPPAGEKFVVRNPSTTRLEAELKLHGANCSGATKQRLEGDDVELIWHDLQGTLQPDQSSPQATWAEITKYGVEVSTTTFFTDDFSFAGLTVRVPYDPAKACAESFELTAEPDNYMWLQFTDFDTDADADPMTDTPDRHDMVLTVSEHTEATRWPFKAETCQQP